MKILTYNKREIEEVEYLEDIKAYEFKATFKSLIIYYQVPKSKLFFIDEAYIDFFKDGTHRLYIILDSDKNFVNLDISKRIIKKGSAIDKYIEREYEPLDYVNYYQYDIFAQLDGITTIVGMTGAGKTYSALSMMTVYADYFDKIAYLNFELTDRDIISRFNSMFQNDDAKTRVKDKLYMKDGIMSSLDLEEILMAMDVMADEKVVFVVDNVGSVVGQEDNVYQRQNQFLKELDVLCKERGFHALALTQTIKDSNLDIFDENEEIKGGITASIMSGSIVLGNLSRTILFTGYNGRTGDFKVKVLKKGTGLYYDGEGANRDDNYTKR